MRGSAALFVPNHVIPWGRLSDGELAHLRGQPSKVTGYADGSLLHSTKDFDSSLSGIELYIWNIYLMSNGVYMEKNTPLTSSDHGRLLVFFLISAVSSVLVFGIVPTLFLCFGVYMTKKNEDFSYIDNAVKYYKIYYIFLLILILFASIMDNRGRSITLDYLSGPAFFLSVFVGFIFIINYLFYSPLKKHSFWVENHGIFSNAPKPYVKADIKITGAEGVKVFSVADELLKWAKLKEEGHVTQAQYEEARKKLLG